MARPIELTLELLEGIANLVRAGNFPVRAASAKGIPRSTWYSWLARGREAAARRNHGSKVPKREALFVALVDAMERAESESQVIAVNSLMKAMPTTPSAVIAWLERRYPGEWSRTERQQVEMSGPEGGPVATVDITMEVIEKARKIRERLLSSGTVVAIPAKSNGNDRERDVLGVPVVVPEAR